MFFRRKGGSDGGAAREKRPPLSQVAVDRLARYAAEDAARAAAANADLVDDARRTGATGPVERGTPPAAAAPPTGADVHAQPDAEIDAALDAEIDAALRRLGG